MKTAKKIGNHVLLVLVFASVIQASSVVRQVNIEQLTADAPRIFLGKCVATRSGHDDYQLPATFYTFEVSKVLKGSLPRQLTIKQFGGSDNKPDSSVLRFDGMPEYVPGETYLLFLGAESKLGFTSPQGLSQGAFRTFRDPDSKRLAAENGVKNRGLFRGLKREVAPAGRVLALRKDVPESPVFLDDLMGYIAQLLKK